MELDAARRQLAGARAAEATAAEGEAALQAALLAETGQKAPEAFANWLPAAKTSLAQAGALRAMAADRLDRAREAAARASLAERAIVEEAARRRAADRAARLARDQAAMDDLPLPSVRPPLA
ncbi:hypothetical protein [Falsiroseomonas selenitidurans]|uniref:hypothetical protein n=1 Tax=Falsiroseomonas selenitidurans TaxID=2716335 RepID=UPI001ADE435B|nr:hypothetical protein [Falsiroseomonas selenitidurans]